MSYPRVQIPEGTYPWQKSQAEGYFLYQLTTEAGVHADKLIELRLQLFAPGSNDVGAVAFRRILISGRMVDSDGVTRVTGAEPLEIQETERSITTQRLNDIGRNAWLSIQITEFITMLINMDVDAVDFSFLPIVST